MYPIEPPSTAWCFPDLLRERRQADDLVAMGADLEPGTLLRAYRSGYFPMPGEGGVLTWWSPVRRGILPLDCLRVTRSLAKSTRRYDVTFDQAFGEVMRGCADPGRPGSWIDEDFRIAYQRLHELGWAHSVEVWQDGGLVGGLYGVAINGLFAGESMFHRATDASKVALVALVSRLRGTPSALLDVQWQTPHLSSLGVIEVDRADYLTRLTPALSAPSPWT